MLKMTLSPWVLLAAVAGCCGLIFEGVGAVAATDSSTSKPNQQHGFVNKDTDASNDSFHRRLQTRACGEEIGRVTESEMRGLATTLLSAVLAETDASDLTASAVALFTNSLSNDVVAYKVCGSCAQTEASLSQEALSQDESVFGSFSSYCASDSYGYSAEHSALVFVPVVTNSTSTSATERADTETTTIVEGSLRSFISMHFTLVTVSSAPTEFWPANLTEALALDNAADALVPFVDYFTALTAAGSGAVAIMPDYIGYGESSATHNRTYAYLPTYMQAAMTTWMATKQAIEQDTYEWSINDGNGGCTVMDSVLSLAGLSEGGAGAIAAASAMQQVGLRVLGVNAGAPPLDAGDSIEFVIESFDTGLVSVETNNAIFYTLLPLLAFAYSSENPGLANSGTEQLLLAPEWRVSGDFDSNIISWLDTPDFLTSEEIGLRVFAINPINPTEILNADYLDLVRQARAANVSFACNSDLVLANVTDKLCEAINSGSLLNVVANYDMPLQLCYSEDDTVVSPRLFTDSDINVFGKNPNVTNYPGPLGFLTVSGDHLDTLFLCSVASLETFVDLNDADRPNLISPLTGEKAAVCASSKTAPSSAPTTSTSGAPLMFSRVATSSGIALVVALLSLSMF